MAAALVPAAEARQLSAARATFKVSFEGTYSAKATGPYDGCMRWAPRADQPGAYELQQVPYMATATENGSFRSTVPASFSVAGPYGSFPLSPEGEPRAGRVSVQIQRASDLHDNNTPNGCYPGDTPSSPWQDSAGDCGARSVTPAFEAGNSRAAKTNSSKALVAPGYYFNDPYQSCGMPGGVVLSNLRGKAETAALKAAGPRVGRLFSGSKKIVERGSATVNGSGTDQGSAASYTVTIKVTLKRTKLTPARHG